VLYPPGLRQDRWLDAYANAFSVVEVNNSFYRLPERTTFERWRDGTPSDFTFAVKASRYLTHLKRLKEPGEGIRRFAERSEGLGDKLGPVLFQLPPRFPAEPTRLGAFLGALPRAMRAAWEFRDPSWMSDEVLGLLDDAGCALVLADRPGFRGSTPVTGGWSYVRFHQGTRRGPGYRRDKLRRWADRLAALEAREVWAFFNNDSGGAAVRDARALREILAERGVRVA
jgi:uncharacterized protein YecE (DUF72 family)